jgi:hypothetical protein
MGSALRIWLARFAIGLVLFFNIQCAVAFLWSPQNYASGFELEGVVGVAMLRGMGVLFFMWNIPYLFAVWDPVKNRLSLYEATIMQAIGFLGESAIVLTLDGNHPAIHASLQRFIAFDGAGLLALILAGWITHRIRRQIEKPGR